MKNMARVEEDSPSSCCQLHPHKQAALVKNWVLTVCLYFHADSRLFIPAGCVWPEHSGQYRRVFKIKEHIFALIQTQKKRNKKSASPLVLFYEWWQSSLSGDGVTPNGDGDLHAITVAVVTLHQGEGVNIRSTLGHLQQSSTFCQRKIQSDTVCLFMQHSLQTKRPCMLPLIPPTRRFTVLAPLLAAVV